MRKARSGSPAPRLAAARSILALPAPDDHKSALAKWVTSALRPKEGAVLPVAGLHTDYRSWAIAQGIAPMPAPEFRATFLDIAGVSGFRVEGAKVVGLARA